MYIVRIYIYIILYPSNTIVSPKPWLPPVSYNSDNDDDDHDK